MKRRAPAGAVPGRSLGGFRVAPACLPSGSRVASVWRGAPAWLLCGSHATLAWLSLGSRVPTSRLLWAPAWLLCGSHVAPAWLPRGRREVGERQEKTMGC